MSEAPRSKSQGLKLKIKINKLKILKFSNFQNFQN
jgi:hypothetical protein